MNAKRLPSGIVVLATLLTMTAFVSSSFGIGMRHDVANVDSNTTSNPYVDFGSQFDSVVRLSWTTNRGTFQASGTLVSSVVAGEYKILTAAHVIDGNSGAGSPDGIIDASQYTIEFGDNQNSISHSVSIPRSSIAVQPRWATGDPAGTGLLRGAAQFDLAVLTFSASDLLTGNAGTLPTPYGLTTVDPLGQTGTIVGFGRSGTGDDFASISDGVRRAGQNAIDALDSLSAEDNDGFTLRADFDAAVFPEERNVIGYDGAIQELEASTALGDSGGPLLIGANRPLVAGVLHGGYNDFSNANISEYGDVGVWTSVIEPINMLFLQANDVAYYGSGVAAFPVSGPVTIPEPSAGMLSLFSLVGLLFRRRRSNR